jgi:hypothetical protein
VDVGTMPRLMPLSAMNCKFVGSHLYGLNVLVCYSSSGLCTLR